MSDCMDRTSQIYFDKALEYAFAVQPRRPIIGILLKQPPESLEELKNSIEVNRESRCRVSDGVDAFIDLIAADPDPDDIVRRLPCSKGHLAFILPSPEMEQAT